MTMTAISNNSKEKAGERQNHHKPHRVVSLLGASTETIYRLGLEGVLVGRSHECDYPPACLKLPCISRARLDPDTLSSVEIDGVVRDFAAQNEPVYKLQDDTLLALQPDLLIAQDHCRVCAVTAKDIDASAACHKIPQLIVKPGNLSDCLDDVLKVANALGYPERGLQLYTTLQDRMERVRQLGLSQQQIKQPRVALLEWCDPVMGCGYWLPELVTLAGGICLFSTPPGGCTPTLTFQSLVDAKLDVIVFALCGFGIDRTIQELRKSFSQEQLHQLLDSCSCKNQVFVTDGNFLFNRSGPRVVESAEVLLEALYKPLRGHFGHLGSPFLMTLQNALDLPESSGTKSSGKNRPNVQPEEEASRLAPPPPSKSALEMVGQQLACLRAKDMVTAFALNSTANQKRWCDAGRFAQVLQTHEDFKRLLQEVPVLKEAITPSNGIVQVALVNGTTLVWTCVVEQKDGVSVWRTEKVAFGQD